MEISLSGAKKIRVILNNNSYEIDVPKVKHQRLLEESIFYANKEGKPVLGIVIDFLATTGLPKEVIEDMSEEQIETLVEGLKSKKKS